MSATVGATWVGRERISSLGRVARIATRPDGMAAAGRMFPGASTNAVATLDTPFADPDMETMRQKFNEMLLAARR